MPTSEYGEYVRINGPGPHLCERCAKRNLGPGGCFDSGLDWHCGCGLPAWASGPL